MEKKQRVLAYQLATPLTFEELAHVAGGKGNTMTSHQTFKPTGNSSSSEVVYDVTFDW